MDHRGASRLLTGIRAMTAVACVLLTPLVLRTDRGGLQYLIAALFLLIAVLATLDVVRRVRADRRRSG